MLEEMFQQSMIEILSERVLLPLGMNRKYVSTKESFKLCANRIT